MTAKTPAAPQAPTTPEDRLTAAVDAEQAARDKLSQLRESHKTSSGVTAQEFGDAAHALELAELERQGAEDALAEAQRRERLAKLAAISADIEARAHPARAAEAFTAASDALADLIRETGPDRTRMLGAWQREMSALGVRSVVGNERPSAEDGGLSWRDYGWGGTPGAVLHTDAEGKLRAVQPYDLFRLLDALVARACRQTGVHTNLLGAGSNPPAGLAEDPAGWFKRN